MVSLPTKPELIAMLLGLLLSPLQQLLATIKLYSEKKAK